MVLRPFLPAMLVTLAASAPGCDDKRGRDLPPPAPSALAAALGIDAASIEPAPVDPPAPAGDLKSEVDRFSTLDACVAEHAKLDPLVGDALHAIGYETFLRDSCRLLEATKEKNRERCAPIDSSSLRARCETFVAMAAATPEACPLETPDAPSHGRVTSCVAIASRDPRLCAGEARANRATCEALVLRDETRCGALGDAASAACKREVARWRSLLGPAQDGLPKLPAVRAQLELHGADGTADPPATSVDLGAEYARGAVFSGTAERGRIVLGTVDEIGTTPFAPAPTKKARVGVSVLVGVSPASARLERVELEVPGESTLVYPGVRCDCKVTATKLDRARGGEVALVFEGTVGVSPRAYKAKAEIATFIRDVVNDPSPKPR